MKKNFLKGSYTVEAAVLFSVTVFIMAGLILCTFYLHDKAVCQSAACEAAASGSNFFLQKDRSHAAAQIKKQFKQERLLGGRELSGHTAAGKKEVSARWKAVYPVPGAVVQYFCLLYTSWWECLNWMM